MPKKKSLDIASEKIRLRHYSLKTVKRDKKGSGEHNISSTHPLHNPIDR